MSNKLPSLRTSSTHQLKIQDTTFTITPFSNAQIIKYTSIRDTIEVDDTNKHLSKFLYEEKIFEILVQPNVLDISKEEFNKLSSFIKLVLYMEMYVISKGHEIKIQYNCEKCFEEKSLPSSFTFDLSDDVSFEENIKISNFSFNLNDKDDLIIYLQNSDLDLHSVILDELPNEVEATKYGYQYILSHIKYIKIGESEFHFSLDEVYDWFVNELDVETFNFVINQIIINVPHIGFEKTDIECQHCGNISHFVSQTIPDLSIIPEL